MIIVVSLALAGVTLFATGWLVLHTTRTDRLEHAEGELRQVQTTLERLLKEQKEAE